MGNTVEKETTVQHTDCIETLIEFDAHTQIRFALSIESVSEGIVDVATINAALCNFIRKEMAKIAANSKTTAHPKVITELNNALPDLTVIN